MNLIDGKFSSSIRLFYGQTLHCSGYNERHRLCESKFLLFPCFVSHKEYLEGFCSRPLSWSRSNGVIQLPVNEQSYKIIISAFRMNNLITNNSKVSRR